MYKEKKIVVNINQLLNKNDISLRELGRLASIDISALSTLSRGLRKRIDLGHIKRIAEALDIDDINEILSIENVVKKEND